MITFNKEKDRQEFLQKVTKLSPEQFIGLVKLLDIKLSTVNLETNEATMRDAEEIFQDCFAAFCRLKHKMRKQLLKAMEEGNGATTEH